MKVREHVVGIKDGDLSDAAHLIRQARYLVEKAMALVDDMPTISARLEVVRQELGELGGDFQEGEITNVTFGR